METMRQQKMGRQVQKELGDIFLKHGRDYFSSAMVTVTQVKLTPDLGMARVYLSVFPNKDTEDLFERIESKKGEIRKHLGNKLGKRTRRIPDLEFFHDEIEEEASKIDRLLKNLNIPSSDKE